MYTNLGLYNVHYIVYKKGNRGLSILKQTIVCNAIVCFEWEGGYCELLKSLPQHAQQPWQSHTYINFHFVQSLKISWQNF